MQGKWSSMRQPGSELTEWQTGVSVPLLKYVGARSVDVGEEKQDFVRFVFVFRCEFELC